MTPGLLIRLFVKNSKTFGSQGQRVQVKKIQWWKLLHYKVKSDPLLANFRLTFHDLGVNFIAPKASFHNKILVCRHGDLYI